MTKTQDTTIGSIEIESLAFRGFENPEDLDLQGVRKVCAALLMASLSQNRNARAVMREHKRETTTFNWNKVDHVSIEQQADRPSKDENDSKVDLLSQTVTLASAVLYNSVISKEEAVIICDETLLRGLIYEISV